MFDIGFWELTVIGVIALLVVGPERLPAMARTLGLWVGRLRRYVSHVRDDIEREIQAEELREMMKESGNLKSIGESLSEAGQALNEVKRDLESNDSDLSEDKSGKDTTVQSVSEAPSAMDAAATGVGEVVSGGNPQQSNEDKNADASAGSDQDLSINERRSG